MEFKVIKPQSSAGAGARWSDRRSAQRARREGSSESNRHEFSRVGSGFAGEFLCRVYLRNDSVAPDLSPFGPTIGCSTSCPDRHSVVVQMCSASKVSDIVLQKPAYALAWFFDPVIDFWVAGKCLPWPSAIYLDLP